MITPCGGASLSKREQGGNVSDFGVGSPLDTITGVNSVNCKSNRSAQLMKSYLAIDIGFASVTYSTAISYLISAKYTDNETGLLYYGFRYYQPSTGRWISRDPIGENGGTILYVYCANNSLEWVDAFGLQDFYVFSGVRPGAWSSSANYMQQLAHQAGLPTPVNASYNPAYPPSLGAPVSNHPSRSDTTMLPDMLPVFPFSELILNAEASEKAAQAFRPAQFCGNTRRKIKVLMIAPKTTADNPSSRCCDIEIRVLYDPRDIVPNLALYRGTQRDWSQIINGGSVVPVNLAGGTHHSVSPLDTPYSVARRETILEPGVGRLFSWRQGPSTVTPQTILRDWLADHSNHSVMLCHSQGCNILMHGLARACCACSRP